MPPSGVGLYALARIKAWARLKLLAAGPLTRAVAGSVCHSVNFGWNVARPGNVNPLIKCCEARLRRATVYCNLRYAVRRVKNGVQECISST